MDNQGQELKKLKLEDIACNTLDLRCAARLTYLNLSKTWHMHECVQPKFVTHPPTSLVECTLVGVVVSRPAARLNFDSSKKLTKPC